jgi:protease PrsW
MLAAFLWGAVPSIIFALIAQNGLDLVPAADGEFSLMSELYAASFIAPLTEEIFKGIGVLLIFSFFRREIDSILDGLIYGSMVGFGFSAVENILYFAGQPDAGSLLFLFFLRAFVFGMLHALFTGLTGVGFALGKFTKYPFLRLLWPLLGLIAAMATHSIHNYFATIGGTHLLFAVLGISLGMIWFLVIVSVSLIHENRWIRIQLSEEVDQGVLFAEQALDTATFWSRSSLSAFSRGFGIVFQRRRLLHEATELAYLKQKLPPANRTPEEETQIINQREKVRHLSRTDPLVLSGAIQPGRRLPPPLPPVRRIPPSLPPRLPG